MAKPKTASGKKPRKKKAVAKKNGRPPIKTVKVREVLVSAFERGVKDWNTAAHIAGISPRTLREWRENEPDLSAALDKARAMPALLACTRMIEAVDRGDWKAVEKVVDANCPEYRAGPSVAVQVNNTLNEGPPVPKDDSDLHAYAQNLWEVASSLAQPAPKTNGQVGTNGKDE